jgi:hypothetical protein
MKKPLLSLLAVFARGPRTMAAAALVPAVVCLAACDDSAKKSEQVAVDTLASITPLVEKDMADVREGLPDAVKFLSTDLPADPASDLKSTQESIKRTREHNDKLRLAKSTFFVVTNAEGVILRSETNPDDLVDKNLFASFPDLKKALDQKDGVVEQFGEMNEMRGVKKGVDMAWVIATQLPGKEKARGVFASGWSFRSYAYYLEQQAKRVLEEAAKKTPDHKIPVMYTYVVKAGKAFGGSETPDENSEAVAKLDLASKAKGGLYRTHVEITGRTFGIAATPIKSLGDDAALVVVASVY